MEATTILTQGDPRAQVHLTCLIASIADVFVCGNEEISGEMWVYERPERDSRAGLVVGAGDFEHGNAAPGDALSIHGHQERSWRCNFGR
jgi:hypothetical protein